MRTAENSDAAEKVNRQKAILEVLERDDIGTQEDLVAVVRKRGFECTQTTISRDLAEMNVIKFGKAYRSLTDVPVSPLERTFSEHALGVAIAGDHLVVLKTRPGSAQTVAIALDRAGWKEIVGTLAGDDTIFVALPGKKEGETVMRKFKRLLPAGGAK